MTDLLAEAVAATDWKRNPHKTAAGQAAALRAALRERGVHLVTVESLAKAHQETVHGAGHDDRWGYLLGWGELTAEEQGTAMWDATAILAALEEEA